MLVLLIPPIATIVIVPSVREGLYGWYVEVNGQTIVQAKMAKDKITATRDAVAARRQPLKYRTELPF